MPAESGNLSMDAQVLAWALDELDKNGQGYHVSVAWGPELVPVPGQPGVQAPLPHWALFITGINPIIGEPRLNAMKDLGFSEPEEATVRKAAAEAVVAMNALGRNKLAQQNGGHL
jgi:hypothetical protein